MIVFFLNSWKITLQLKYSILWRVHLFELSCYFIITQFLPLYFQWLYLRGTKLHNFHNFLTFSLYYMYYNSISTHSMFMSLKDLFKNISYIAFEEKISKFRKKKKYSHSCLYHNYHERVFLDFLRIRRTPSPVSLSLPPPNRFISTDLVPSLLDLRVSVAADSPFDRASI